ncbi:hypothetical protein [Bradyrhizobium sp. 150]|uniref:hypothetical protein n=1 Tax=Bradyrhizobium sp. 150 TaxID=2782625 RepID=UPI001FFBBF5C|nr:hypothetical protein [Bradyrhizobium sp. 150]MCK1671061.1 hypothetical protein [Bradyrhizobium sp. 150]
MSQRFTITRKRSVVPSEHTIQARLITILKYAKRPEIFVFAIPNAGRRGFQTAARLQAEGMKAGVADLCFLFPIEEGAVAFLEMKTIGGSLSVAQMGFRSICRHLGIRWETAKTLDEAIGVMRAWNVLKPNAVIL